MYSKSLQMRKSSPNQSHIPIHRHRPSPSPPHTAPNTFALPLQPQHPHLNTTKSPPAYTPTPTNKQTKTHLFAGRHHHDHLRKSNIQVGQNSLRARAAGLRYVLTKVFLVGVLVDRWIGVRGCLCIGGYGLVVRHNGMMVIRSIK